MARRVILVEGESDRVALETLASRLALDEPEIVVLGGGARDRALHDNRVARPEPRRALRRERGADLPTSPRGGLRLRAGSRRRADRRARRGARARDGRRELCDAPEAGHLPGPAARSAASHLSARPIREQDPLCAIVRRCPRSPSRARSARTRTGGRPMSFRGKGRPTGMTDHLSSRTRWLALVILCVGDLMIVVDTTVVNVALPSIRTDLGFSQTSLAWVVNAYMLTFGGFLLLAGRFGDLFGHRRLFLIGTAAFTTASLVCGLSTTKGMLVAARAVQGLGGAVVSAVAFSLIVVLFTEPSDRAKAMGVFGFVMSGGGSIGVLAGGVLTDLVGWHWIFLVNLPIGIAVLIAGLPLLPAVHTGAEKTRVDVPGAMVLAVYAIVNGNTAGWTSLQTLGLLAAAVVIGVAFVTWEAHVTTPLMP